MFPKQKLTLLHFSRECPRYAPLRSAGCLLYEVSPIVPTVRMDARNYRVIIGSLHVIDLAGTRMQSKVALDVLHHPAIFSVGKTFLYNNFTISI